MKNVFVATIMSVFAATAFAQAPAKPAEKKEAPKAAEAKKDASKPAEKKDAAKK